MYIAWTGTAGTLNVQCRPSGPKITLPETSNNGPALAFYGGRFYLAWTGTEGQLNVISSSNGGVDWGNKVTLPEASNVGPALVVSFNLLCLIWTGTDGQLNLIFSKDFGQKWGDKVTLPQTSALAPATAVGSFQVQAIAWAATDKLLHVLVGMGIGRGPAGALTAP